MAITAPRHTPRRPPARYRAAIAQRGNPGYQASSVLLGESELALALDRDKLSDLRGVLTPAAAMADALLDRLPAAGVTLRVVRLSCRGYSHAVRGLLGRREARSGRIRGLSRLPGRRS